MWILDPAKPENIEHSLMLMFTKSILGVTKFISTGTLAKRIEPYLHYEPKFVHNHPP
jgi:hypothetical protein